MSPTTGIQAPLLFGPRQCRPTTPPFKHCRQAWFGAVGRAPVWMSDSDCRTAAENQGSAPVSSPPEADEQKPPLDSTGRYRMRAIWLAMRRRCLNPRAANYSRYGGRGIMVCERWLTFENFLADMGQRPADTSLDRIDNNGHYEPGNCQWASPSEQARNKRSSRVLEFAGERKTLAEWADVLRIPRTTLHTRIVKNNWPVGRAFSTPIRPRQDMDQSGRPLGENSVGRRAARSRKQWRREHAT